MSLSSYLYLWRMILTFKSKYTFKLTSGKQWQQWRIIFISWLAALTLPCVCQPGRDHNNPLKPSTSSHTQQKWRELLLLLWSSALAASWGQPRCYRCHIDETLGEQSVRSPPIFSVDNPARLLKGERLSCSLCKSIEGVKGCLPRIGIQSAVGIFVCICLLSVFTI